MSEQAEEPVNAAPSDDIPAEAAVSDDPKKSVKFECNELTFDEAQAEIDAIKARAGQARENLKSPASASSSYKSSYSSYSTPPMAYEEDVPKSKNMLSHLNSNSAMISYKVTTARNLVQKQEALLRNLKMMRENMERSSVEISRASDYLSPIRVPQRGYFEKRAESAPLISRRQVRDLSPQLSSTCNLEFTERLSEKASSPAPVSFSSRISTLPTPVSTNDYEPDADFEKEMAALRKRVADLSNKANEVTTPKYSSYDYDSAISTTPLVGYNADVYAVSEPKIEVKNVRTPKFVPKTHHITLPPRTVQPSKHVSIDNGVSNSYPRNTYTEYLMESLKDLDTYPTANSSLDLPELYADPLVSSTTDYPIAY